MQLSKEQIDYISSSILVSDIKEYIEKHKEEYELFLEKENSKKIP